ncbi:MAG TPA: rhomboid family intramembrane serine protease [Pirellulaceae bacterium]|nr:rhomboid family intramembrane serine protease [Pirellulaceae bacterium]
MGIEDRDYTRDSSDYTGTLTGFGLDYIPPVVKWIIIANVVVFVAQIFVVRERTPADAKAALDRLPKKQRELVEKQRDAQRKMYEKEGLDPADYEDVAWNGENNVSMIQEWFQLEARQVARGQVWRLLTYAFCHDRFGLWHILFNMLLLYWCAVTLESMLGPREFLFFYLVAAVFAGLVEFAFNLYLGSSIPVVGASGAVMAVGMLYAIHYPRTTIRLFWFWPIEARWVVLFYVLYNLHPLLLALGGTQYFTGSAFACHLGGLAFGFLYYKLNLNLERWWDLLPKPRGSFAWSGSGARRPPRRASARREPSIDDQVDEILRKIHESGRESLTDAERRLLDRASQRYKDRRDV